MGLIEFFDACEAQLTETLAGLTVPVLPPLYRRFKSELRMEDDFPRIAWVIGQERIVGNDQTGGDGVGNPSQLWKRLSFVLVHIWEADVSATEILLNHLVAAIHTRFFGSYTADGGQWNAGEATNQRGAAYTLRLSVFFPLTREPTPTAVITSFPETPELELMST